MLPLRQICLRGCQHKCSCCFFVQVLSTRVITDRDTGASRGYGFVNMADVASAQTAMAALDNYKLNDRVLAVKIAGKKDGPMGGPGAPAMRPPGMMPPPHPAGKGLCMSACILAMCAHVHKIVGKQDGLMGILGAPAMRPCLA